MLRLGRKRNQLFYTLLFAGAIGIGGSMFQTANAANSYVPELNIYQQGAFPKIEVGIDMADTDVFYTCNFTDESRIDFLQSVNNYGHQSITSEDYYSGGKSLKCYDNKRSKMGNHLWSPMMTDADSSHFVIKDTCRAPNMSLVSVNFKAKSRNSNSTVSAVVGGKEEINYGVVAKDWNNHTVKYRDTIDWRQPPNKVYVYADEGPVVFDVNQAYMLCTSKDFGYFTNIWYRWSYDEQCFYSFNLTDLSRTTDTRRKAKFNAGESLLMYEHSGIFPPSKEIPGDSQWHTYSCNVRLDKFAEHPDQYDYYNQGVGLEFVESTDGTLYIDDVKFGKASRVQIQRDNSTQVYEGYDSDIVDTGFVVKPNVPDISTLETLDVGFKLGFEATTNQEKHTYKARSCRQESNDWSIWSKEFPVTMISTPSKYHVKLYKNGNLIKDEDTTAKEIIYTDAVRGDKITGEIYTIDTEGQKSSATPINYTVKQTLKDYKADVKQLEDDSNKVKKQYSYEEKKDIKANITKAAEDLRTNPNLNKYKPNTVINGLDTDASEFKAGDKLVNIYIK